METKKGVGVPRRGRWGRGVQERDGHRDHTEKAEESGIYTHTSPGRAVHKCTVGVSCDTRKMEE